MNNTKSLKLWLKALNLLRSLLGLEPISPVIIGVALESICADWQPANPKLLPAPPEYLLLPASIAKKE